MSFDINKYAQAQYDDDDYNCLHFAVDAYRDITGIDMELYVSELMTGRDKRKVNPAKLRDFDQLTNPVDPCLALMHGPELHCGIYHQNKIIHFNDRGVQAQPPHIAEIQHGRIKYYAIPH